MLENVGKEEKQKLGKSNRTVKTKDMSRPEERRRGGEEES